MQNLDQKMDKWIESLPDYEDCLEVVNTLSTIDQKIIRIKRAIDKADKETLAISSNPRSNETRIARDRATEALRDELMELEVQRIKAQWMFDFVKLTKDIANVINYHRFLHKS